MASQCHLVEAVVTSEGFCGFFGPDLVFPNLFSLLQTNMLNKHLSSLMSGLTAKVFRTYNASITLQQQLKELTNGKTHAQQSTNT